MSQVKGMYANANYGFLVRDVTENGTGAEQAFHSREKGANPPHLVLEFRQAGSASWFAARRACKVFRGLKGREVWTSKRICLPRVDRAPATRRRARR